MFPTTVRVQDLADDEFAVSGYIDTVPSSITSDDAVEWIHRYCVLSNGHMFLFESAAMDSVEIDRMELCTSTTVFPTVKLASPSPLAFEIVGDATDMKKSWMYVNGLCDEANANQTPKHSLSTLNKSSKNTWIDFVNNEIVNSTSNGVAMIPVSRTLSQKRNIVEEDLTSAQERVRRLQMQLELAQIQAAQADIDDLDLQRRLSLSNSTTYGSYPESVTMPPLSARRDSEMSNPSLSYYSDASSARNSVSSQGPVGIRGGGIFGGVDDDDEQVKRKPSLIGKDAGVVLPKKVKSSKAQVNKMYIQF
ncbi:hypothetical protein HDU99_007880 [Rhizoclosmatium hyalinum]|nr:hypothetical protein HDU99_007880 [Rhizoclosmatium hyalinum]